MAVTPGAVLDAIDTSFFIYPEIPGILTRIDVPGVDGRISPVSHPLANLMGAARLGEETADATISRVRDIFASQNKAFGWIVGPTSQPPDLSIRLQAAGLIKVDEMAGMVLHDLGIPIERNPGVRVVEAEPADVVRARGLYAAAYGLPQDVADLLTEMVTVASDEVGLRNYLAYVDGVDEPVAFAAMVRIPNERIVLLGGAGTLPEHRGHGIYTSLVAQRLEDAQSDGMHAAVIQAVRATSAPICERLGFREVAGLEFFAWLPPGSDTDNLHA